jgi:hypothetical protein
VLKVLRVHAEKRDMSDLSNILGNVYTSPDPDAAPVRYEPSAAERAPRVDDDPAAALSQALTTDVAPAPQFEPQPHFQPQPAPAYAPQAAALVAPTFTPTTYGHMAAWSWGVDDIYPKASAGSKKKR